MTGELHSRHVYVPLDPDERLPRELLSESSPVRVIRDSPEWRHLASFAWPAALLFVLAGAMLQFSDAGVALLAAGVLFVAFFLFILGRRH